MLSASPAAHLYATPGGPVAPDPLADASTRDRLAVLDDAQEWSAFSRTLDGRPSCWESSVVFEGVHCAACALTIEDALRAVPGVESVHVSAASHRGRIVWSDAVVKPSGITRLLLKTYTLKSFAKRRNAKAKGTATPLAV